jgi:cellulose synthase/poly-beta-1,6-N-acetylglucosamine synthase-like glycosyltransferase
VGLAVIDRLLFYSYLLVGPLAWALMWCALLFGRSRMNRLRGAVPPLGPQPPSVAIVIPAKDEGSSVAQCIASALAQDYPRFNVIAIDDRSTDDTSRVLDDLAAGDSRLRVLHVPAGGLPEGWLGKCHALYLATRDLSSDWLLFVDSDVTLSATALRHALAVALERRYDAITILTRLDCRTFLERLVLAPAAAAWMTMNVVSWTNEDDRPTAAANGQFFLVRRDRYEAAGNHAAVRDQITEDVELARLLKSGGARVRFLLGSHLATTRMHTNFQQMLHGWGRIYSGSVRRRPAPILLGMLFIVISGLTVYPAAIYAAVCWKDHADWFWLAAAAAHASLMTTYLAYIYRKSGNRMRYAWLFPAAAVYLLIFMSYALRLCHTGRYAWRGSVFVTAGRDEPSK